MHLQRPDAGGEVDDAIEALSFQRLLQRVHPHPQAQVEDRVAVLDDGRVVESGSVYDVFAQPRTEAAARIIGTALRDRPSAATLARLRLTHKGRLVTVRVRDRVGFQTTLAGTFLRHAVAAEIVFGGVSELQDRPVGSLTFELAGEAAAVDAALTELHADGVTVTEEG